MTYAQLTVDGGEIEHPPEIPRARPERPLNDVQQAVMRLFATQEIVRSVEAGTIVHRTRDHCGFHGPFQEPLEDRLSCCGFAGKDGLAVLNRLLKRGLVRRVENGKWTATWREQK